VSPVCQFSAQEVNVPHSVSAQSRIVAVHEDEFGRHSCLIRCVFVCRVC